MNAEMETVGLLTYDRDNLWRALSVGLKAEHFQTERWRNVFLLILELDAKGEPFGISDLATRIRAPLNASDLAEIADPHIGQAIEYHAKEIVASSWCRAAMVKFSAMARDIQHRPPYEDAQRLKDAVINSLDELLTSGDPCLAKNPRELALAYTGELEERIQNPQKGKGISTGFIALDASIFGFKPSRLYVLGGLTSGGKTTLATQFAVNAGRQGKHTVFFTNEMTAKEVLEKIISQHARISGRSLEHGDLSEADCDGLMVSAQWFAESANIHIVDNSYSKFEALSLEARRLKRAGKLDFLVVDYLQQYEFSGRSFDGNPHRIGEVAKSLKELSQRLEIPVLALAQLNRTADTNSKEPPRSSQLDGSSGIEKYADTILLLHPIKDESGAKTVTTDLIVTKNRRGSLCKMPLIPDLKFSSFKEG